MNQNKKTIRWGIIGCGAVTEIKSGPGFQKANNSTLIAVMRRDSKKAENFARRHQVPKWYDKAEFLIHDDEVDAIYIATPPETHKYYTLQVASAHKPVYVEKPMARTYSECKAMLEACEQAKIPLFVAYYRRSLERFIKVKNLLAEEVIGDIRFVKAVLFQPPTNEELNPSSLPWRVIPEIAGGGKFLDLASHTLDILDYLLGPIVEVHGIADNQLNLYAAEDIVSAIFKFESAIVGTGIWCFTAFQHYDTVEIVGNRGKITFSTFMNKPINLVTEKYEKSWQIDTPEHIQQNHIQSIVNELNYEGKCPSDGVSAARTNWVMDEVLKSWRERNNLNF